MAERRRVEGNIEWRGSDRFRVRVANGRHPDGRVRWERRPGKGNEKDADRALHELIHEVEHGIQLAPERVTVEDWLRRWLPRRRVEGDISDRTFERYTGIVERHLVPNLGRLRLRQVRPDTVSDLKAKWLDGDAGASPLSPTTVQKHLNVLRRSFQGRADCRTRQPQPRGSCHLPSAAGAPERRALTEDEIVCLVGAAHGARFAMPTRLTLATGLRQSEMLSLR